MNFIYKIMLYKQVLFLNEHKIIDFPYNCVDYS